MINQFKKGKFSEIRPQKGQSDNPAEVVYWVSGGECTDVVNCPLVIPRLVPLSRYTVLFWRYYFILLYNYREVMYE